MNQIEDKAITLGHPSYVWRFGQDRRLDLINRHAPLAGRRVLDVGCGLGMYVRKFRAFTTTAFGVDIDLDKLAQAAEELPNLAQSVAESLPFADGSFDVILLHEVIEHVRSDREAVTEAYRCLRPGGRVVIFAPNRLYPLETHGFYLGKRYVYKLAPIIPWLPDGLRRRFCPHVRTYRAADIRRLFAGLPGEYDAFTQVYPGYDKIASRRPRLARLLRGATYLMESTPLRAFGISHLAVFRKPPE
jgi:SAM-dependent methyltransferase